MTSNIFAKLNIPGRFIVATGLLLTLGIGCTKKQAGDPIVIPPGELVSYSNAEFLPYSQAYYTIDFQKYDPVSKAFFSIEDLTPKDGKGLEQTLQYIVPKDKNAPGTFLLKVTLPRQGLSFTSFFISGRENRPGLITTLVVDLVSNYTDMNLETLSATSIVNLETAAAASVERAKAEFQISDDDIEVKEWIKFLKNYLSRDLVFLAAAKAEGFKFPTAFLSGLPNAAPYPFGFLNNLPTMDVANSTSLARHVSARETEDLVVKGKLQDGDDDLILYRWYLDGKLYSKDPEQITWTPDFTASRTAPYTLRLDATDGGLPVSFTWLIDVIDRNRPPVLLSTCGTAAKEGDTWTCVLNAVDYDDDPITFTLSDRTTYGRLLVDGVPTDDVTRSLAVTGKTQVTLTFTPNNYDAKKRAAYLEINLSDGKLGQTTVPINLVVEDINSPPYIVYVAGNPLQPLPGSPATPHEWDYCGNVDPDGTQPYRFMIEVKDPDNQPEAGPRSAQKDLIDFSYSGTLKDALTVLSTADGCPAATDTSSYFCFEWKPYNLPRTGNITLTLKDDHGGITQIPSPSNPAPITLTSADRNVRPCFKANQISNTLSDNLPLLPDKFGGDDADETSPWPELANVPLPVIPLLTSTDSTPKNLIFKKTFLNSGEWISRFPNAGTGAASAIYNVNFKQPIAGMIEFSRTAPGTGDITINAGTVFTTSLLPKVQYAVSQTVVMNASDKELLIPVNAVNRTVAVGKLNRFINAPPFTATVSNTSALSSTTGTVQLTRPTATVSVLLPAGTELGTSEVADGTDTARYETVDNVTMGVGVLTMSIRVTHKNVIVPVGAVTVIPTATWPGPAISIINPVPLTDGSPYSLYQLQNYGVTSNVDRFCWYRRLADSSILDPSTAMTATTAVPAGLTFATSGSLGLEGQLLVSRTNVGVGQTIPSGTHFKSIDGTEFATVAAFTLNAGQSSLLIDVGRVNHTSLPPQVANQDQTCVGWSDINYEPTFTNLTVAKVNEGSALPGFEIDVTDNRDNPLQPNDPLDRHTFTAAVIGTPPVGPYMLCRQPATDASDITVPACSPCTNTTGTYFEDSACFLRFAPNIADVSQTFSFNITVDDHGMTYPANTNVRTQVLNVTVVEHNDPPVHTDANWIALNNSTVNTNFYLGDFVEGTESKYRLYLTDPDRGTDLKNQIAPTLVRTWQFVSPTGWVQRTNPGLVYVELVAPSVFNASGLGSQTTAQIRWKPADDDAKRLAGTAGFVFEINACDLGTADSPRQCASAFYRMTVRNLNNLPSVVTSISTLNVQADTFSSTSFVVADPDFATNSTFTDTQSSFISRVSLCSAAGVYTCDADQTGWPIALSTYDSPYTGNAAVASCQSAGVLSAYKVPRFELQTPTDGTITGTITATTTKTRNYNYKFNWCPQKKHIGKNLVYFNLADNGDQDIRGASSQLSAQSIQVPVTLNVVAPVFFNSPKKSTTTADATFWMQQAFSLTEYRYELFINNSRGNLLTMDMLIRARIGTNTTIGSPYFEVRPYSAPTTITTQQTTTLTNLNLTTSRIFLVWRPYGATTTTPYVSSATDQTTWPLFQIRAKDQTTGESETVQFRVVVKDPLSPVNVAPVISSFYPNMAAMSIPEQVNQTFSVTATDANSDYLTYRWYVDGVLKSDAGPSFVYLPGMDDAFLPAATPGIHTINVQVVDGQERTTNTQNTWTVVVRNTTPLPVRMTYADTAKTVWTMAQSVIERGYTGGISGLVWGPTLGVGTKSSGVTNNHLLFTGSYSRASVTRNFLWHLQLTNTAFTDNSSTANTQGTELLPWATGRKSEQLGYIQDPANLTSILVGSVKDPSGTFSGTADALKLSPTLTSITSISPTYACTGTCAQGFFQNFAPTGSVTPLADTLVSTGTLPSASYTASGNVYNFFSADEGATLKWNRAGSVPVVLSTLPGNDRIGDIAINAGTKRLYLSVRDPALTRNFIYVYDLSATTSGTVSFLTALNIYDGVNADNRILDLVVDSTKNRIYGLLPGTGGVVALTDNGGSTPTSANLQFIGVPQVASSYTDAVGGGRKLVFNPTSQLLYGIAKDANQIFIIDTMNDAFTIQIFRSDQPLDELVVFPNDGTTLGISRSLGWIYLIR